MNKILKLIICALLILFLVFILSGMLVMITIAFSLKAESLPQIVRFFSYLLIIGFGGVISYLILFEPVKCYIAMIKNDSNESEEEK